VQQPPLPLVERSPTEAVVHRAVAEVCHCSLEEIGERGGE
jgi:hypothetical protein